MKVRYTISKLSKKLECDFVGIDSNKEMIQLALKRRLKKIILRRQKNINLYRKLINTTKISIIEDKKIEKNANVMFITLCEKRDQLQKYLKKFNIQSLIYYKTPLHLHKATKFLGYSKGDFQNAENITTKVLSFPHHQHLSRKEVEFVCKKIDSFYN